MSGVFKVLAAALALTAAAALGGCATTMVRIAGEIAGKVLEDRSGTDQYTDAAIAIEFAKRLVDIDGQLYLDVNVDVWEQRAMLTGIVVDADSHRQVVATLREDRTVKAVYDEIRLMSPAARDRRRAAREGGDTAAVHGDNDTFASDIWIETKIKAQLVGTMAVRSVNFRWRAVAGHVFVIGTARSPMENAIVLQLMRETGGVKAVTSFVHVKGR